MNEKTKTGLRILQAAVLLGVLADILFREASLGINVFIWFTLLVLALLAIVFRCDPEKLNSQTVALHAAVIFFSFTFIVRDSAQLIGFNILAILIILAVQTLSALQIKTGIAGVMHYFASAVFTGFSVFFGPLVLLTADVKWNFISKSGFSKDLLSIAKGIAIALPILFVFGVLFMAADAVFEGLIQNTIQVNPEIVIHAATIGIVSWIVAGYMRASVIGVGLIASKPAERSEETFESSNRSEGEKIDSAPAVEKKKWDFQEVNNSILPGIFTLGSVEIGIVLGLINLLFLIFVIIQIPYLFGGMQLIQNTPDFKLADYARRGFGELIAVAALVLPILLGTHWLLRRDDRLGEKLFRILASIQIGLLFLIMISAAQRLLLLSGNLGYGLTAGRLYPLAFIILLAMIFIWFGATVLRGMREKFAWGALWCGLFVLATMHVLNPDDFIVRTNIRLMQEGRPFDAEYNASLSSDSVPALLQSMPLMAPINKKQILEKLHIEKCFPTKTDDIRSWNWSRRRARALLENVPEVSNKTCVDRSHHPDF